LLCASSAQAATGSPAWRISQIAAPTVFKPGTSPQAGVAIPASGSPLYSIYVTNVGGAPTTEGEPIVIVDRLPEGLTFSADPEPGLKRSGIEGFDGCEPLEPQVIECSITSVVEPGETFEMYVPVDVHAAPAQPGANVVEVSGAGAPSVTDSIPLNIGTALPPFGFLDQPHGATATATEEGGVAATIAGDHPFSLALQSNISTKLVAGILEPVEALKDIAFELPPGMVFNPQATGARCTDAELESRNQGPNSGCPPEAQVGRVNITTYLVGVTPLVIPLYNMEPAPGAPAELAFNFLGTIIHSKGGVNGSFRLTATTNDIAARAPIYGVEAFLWGDPSDPRHDFQREGAGCEEQEREKEEEGCSIEPAADALLTMPASCNAPLPFGSSVLSWEGTGDSAATVFTDGEGNPMQMSGCNALAFEPTIESKTTTNVADSPTGLEFGIHQPQELKVRGRSNAPLKDARVKLPAGLTVNAAAANGLDSCTEEQMGYAPEEGKIRFTTTPQSCPNAAKVGTVEVTTPLLPDPLPGSIYLARPFANPFGSLLSIYLAVESPKDGIVTKLAGKVEPDPTTGQLTTTFTENPELPIEDFHLRFFKGSNAALKTGLTCGVKTTTTTMTPSSTPEGLDAHPSDSFQIENTPAGGACPAQEGEAPNTPAFRAGTATPLSGAYSPFSLRIARGDGTQNITGIDTTLPEGLIGKLAGVSYCPEAAIAQAKSREAPEKGKEEIASPSCPAASEVGSVAVTAGAGIAPIPVSGHVYLAGPYKGAPLSMVVIVPAVAGPFDLGNVVSRVALNVGEYDARINAVSDPLPTILDGVPLDVRSIEVKLDRPGFTLNPTSCEAMAIEGTATTQTGQTAPLKNRFQVGECKRLAFKPAISISLKGGTKRTKHPALKAVVTYPKGGEYANIATAQVSLPHSEFLDQSNIGTVCTQPQLKANSCPAKSVYGKVKAWTPLFDKPLEGNVYLGVGFGHKLPDLVAELNGQIRVLLHGKVDTDKQKGIRNTIEAAPDAPVEKFVLEMKGGPKYGLLVNSEDICKKTQKAGVSFTAANGKVLNLSTKIANSCKGKGKKKRGKR
jgi:hypothetical protein